MQNHSEKIDLLAMALAKAQSQFRGAEEDKVNPHFKSKYSSLNALWEACRDGLSKNGLSVSQLPQRNGNGIDLITILMHSSGQWIQCTLPVVEKIPAPQILGSAITYAKRYALSAIVGIASGDDDDGNSAQAYAKSPHRAVARMEKPAGYDEFYRKIGLHDREDAEMCDFVAETCRRSNVNEMQLVSMALQQQDKFFASFEAWKKQNRIE